MKRIVFVWLFPLILTIAMSGCMFNQSRHMEVTAYSGSAEDCGWERGSWKYLKLDFWNRYVNYGPRKGEKYTGQTASGTFPRQYDGGLLHPTTVTRPWNILFRIARLRHVLLTYHEPGPPFEIKYGLISLDTLKNPKAVFPKLALLPLRPVLIPGLLRPRRGTIAADTDYYPFGTVMMVPGYGTGIVEDRGGAIKGPTRLDLFFRWSGAARHWGRQKNLKVKYSMPN